MPETPFALQALMKAQIADLGFMLGTVVSGGFEVVRSTSPQWW